jgi:hypothetical protein
MKTTQKAIRSYLTLTGSVDCTRWSIPDFNSHNASEGGFDQVAYSIGTYGRNGLVMQGRKTGKFYVVQSRSSALFCFSW